MKDSTAVSNQWYMLVYLWGGAILFDLWFTQYKVKGHLVQFVKNYLVEVMTRKSDKNQLEPSKGVSLRLKIYRLDSPFI